MGVNGMDVWSDEVCGIVGWMCSGCNGGVVCGVTKL